MYILQYNNAIILFTLNLHFPPATPVLVKISHPVFKYLTKDFALHASNKLQYNATATMTSNLWEAFFTVKREKLFCTFVFCIMQSGIPRLVQ